MSSQLKLLVFVLVSAVLLADVSFVVWATKFNLLIVIPVALAVAYLGYVAAYYTVLSDLLRPFTKDQAQRAKPDENSDL